jgi:hypothetical protein
MKNKKIINRTYSKKYFNKICFLFSLIIYILFTYYQNYAIIINVGRNYTSYNKLKRRILNVKRMDRRKQHRKDRKDLIILILTLLQVILGILQMFK